MTAHTMGFRAADRWLQALLTWTPGQTDMIKTVALVLMVTDHAGLLLAHNNEIMRLLGRGCFPLFGLAWGMNLARHAEIRQSQLNSLWGWALVAQVSFMLIGYRGIPGIFCLPLPSRARSCGGSASRPGITPSRRSDCWSPGYPCQPAATAWPEWACSPPAGCFAAHSMHRNGWDTGCCGPSWCC